MAYLIFILVTLALLAGFISLSSYETGRGVRVFARKRTRLDEQVERAEFILAHVDLAAFLREEFHRIAKRVAHDIAHFSLQAVRMVERFLTRLVRRLRMERTANAVPRENAREFVRTLSDFKDKLKETPPEIPDIY
jgi:hypothetical protein